MSDSAIPQVGHPRGGSITITKAIEAMLAAKTAANYRPRYVKSLRVYLGKFAKGRENLPLSDITVETIERWFAERSELPSSQRSNFGRLCTLFSFAERRQWIVKSPMKMMERIRVDPKPPKILSVEQCQRLMEFVMYRHPRALAFVSLALFGAIRPEELRKVTWENVSATTVTVDAAASKVRRRRIVHLRENAVEWLAFARKMGAILPITINAHVSILRRAAAHLGFEDGWPQDILRHTGASMWLAVTNNVGLVAKELGNSPAILLTNYQELVSAEQATAFWSIRPNWLIAAERRFFAKRNPLLAALENRSTRHKDKQDQILDYVVNFEGPTTQAGLAKHLGVSEAAICYTIAFIKRAMAEQEKTAAGN